MLLEQPGQIGGLRLKNRVVMAPMGTNYSTTDGLSTARDVAYYAERARGGVGAIMTEAMVVTEQARPHHNSLCCYHDRFIPGLARIVEAIKEHDCHVFGQLNHRGALRSRKRSMPHSRWSLGTWSSRLKEQNSLSCPPPWLPIIVSTPAPGSCKSRRHRGVFQHNQLEAVAANGFLAIKAAHA